jgi:hypothetical protein
MSDSLSTRLLEWFWGPITARLEKLETQMADNTQSILDAIDAEDAEIERIKNVIAGEFQALKDQIAGMDTVDKARILAAIDASKQKVTGVDPGAA